MRPAIRSVVLAACLLALAGGARAELAWDQAKITELAKQLEAATDALSDTFRRQPPPTLGSPQRKPFYLLKQEVRQLRREARVMSRALQRGADRDETQPSFDNLMETVRRAQDRSRRVSTVAQMHEQADAAREILNQLASYYDPNFTPLEPQRR
jgi:hypothetical protein